MAITVKHSKVSTIPDDADTSLVRPSDWNADHTLVGLGTMAEQNANNVNITGGSITGVTGVGDVVGPASATDNAVARFDTTTGKLIQNSVVTVGDTGQIAGVLQEDFTSTTAPSYLEGRVWYDSTEKALAFYNDSSALAVHVAQDLIVKVINNTGSTIANGSPVYITSTSSGQTYPNVALAKADVAATSSVIGLTNGAIANGAIGYVSAQGLIDNVNTGTFTVGQVLYLSPYSAGQLMNTIPPTGITVQVGVVSFVNSSTGKIYVKQTTPLAVPASIITGQVAVANGGTGQSTASAAFNALSPLTTAGDTLYGGTSGAGTRLAIGTAGQVLTVNAGATAPQWSTPTTGTVTSVSGTGTVSGISLSGTVTSSGNLTLGGTLDLSSPPTIGNTAPNTGKFTTLESTGTASLGTTSTQYIQAVGDALYPQVKAAGSGTDIPLVLQPKGTGALQAQLTDSTATGGNARGANAVDFQTLRSANTMVASGSYSSVLAGRNSTASGTDSHAIGLGCNSSGTGAIAISYNGISNASVSVVLGGSRGTSRSIQGNTVFPASNSPIADVSGNSQSALLILGRQTTDATATVLASNSSAAAATNQIALPQNSAYYFTGEVIAGVTAAGNTKGWSISGVIKRGVLASTTALVGTPTVTSLYADAGASTWSVAVTANTTLGCLTITVTGQASNTIRWVAQIRTTEMTY